MQILGGRSKWPLHQSVPPEAKWERQQLLVQGRPENNRKAAKSRSSMKLGHLSNVMYLVKYRDVIQTQIYFIPFYSVSLYCEV